MSENFLFVGDEEYQITRKITESIWLATQLDTKHDILVRKTKAGDFVTEDNAFVEFVPKDDFSARLSPISSPGMRQTKELQPYQIIGQGGAGVVYQIGSFALKVIPRKRNWLQEVNFLAQFNSPYLAFGEKFFFDRKQVQITMPLYQKIAEMRDEDVTDLAQGIFYLHQAGFVHRDIKPGNFMLHDGVGVLIDLGSVAKEKTLTKTSGMTLTYLAPEVLVGVESRTMRTQDIWAFGCVVYMLYERKHPYVPQRKEKYTKEEVLFYISSFFGYMTVGNQIAAHNKTKLDFPKSIPVSMRLLLKDIFQLQHRPVISEILDELKVQHDPMNSEVQSLMLRIPNIQRFRQPREAVLNFRDNKLTVNALAAVYYDLTDVGKLPCLNLASGRDDLLTMDLLDQLNGITNYTTPVDLVIAYGRVYPAFTSSVAQEYAWLLYVHAPTSNFIGLALTALWWACDRTKQKFQHDESELLDITAPLSPTLLKL